MIPVLTHNGEEVDGCRFEGKQRLGKVGKPSCQIAQHALLKAGVVGDHAGTRRDYLHQRLGTGAARIAAVATQEFMVGDRAVLRLEVKRKLERDLLIWPRAAPARDGSGDGFEVEPGPRPAPRLHCLARTFGIVKRRVIARGRQDAGVASVEIVLVEIEQILDALLRPFLAGSVGEQCHRPFRTLGKIAPAPSAKLALEWRRAMLADLDHRLLARKHFARGGDNAGATFDYRLQRP